MQAVTVEREGNDEDVLSIIIVAYDIRVAPSISYRPPRGCDIFPHFREWLMFTKGSRVSRQFIQRYR